VAATSTATDASCLRRTSAAIRILTTQCPAALRTGRWSTPRPRSSSPIRAAR
jgi:hypothetical protein